MKYKADVIVTLKNGVRDPQGSAIDTILKRMKLEEKPNVGVGKFFSLEVDADEESKAREKLEYICSEILSNPILEKYEVKKFEKV
jgi:phosphoribosylformylglycinamidine synthase